MARKKKVEAGAEAPAEGAAAKGKGNLVPALVVAGGLVIGGFLMGGRSAAPSGAATADGEAARTAEEHVEEEAEPGSVLTLDTITLNLADGSYLKVGLALQLAEGVDPAGGGGHGGGADPASYAAQALDEAIAVLGGHTFEELVSPEGRAAAKQTLSEHISERYHGDVLGVYFTEFVMQ